MREKVMVAAGDTATAVAMEFVLTDAGFDVARVRDAHALARAVSERSCDVVVLDAAFPGCGGFAVLESIRLSGSCHDVPVVMLVARCGSVEHEKARALGADAVVTQPFSGSLLVGTVRSLIASTSSPPVPADLAGVVEPVACHG